MHNVLNMPIYGPLSQNISFYLLNTKLFYQTECDDSINTKSNKQYL